MEDKAYYIVLAFTIFVLFAIFQILEYGSPRAILGTTRGQHRVSAFCDTISTPRSARLVDPVLTRDGYFVGNLECWPVGPFKSVAVKNLIVSTYFTECPTDTDSREQINWLRDWLIVKCLSVQDVDGYKQTLTEQIRSVSTGPNPLGMFYRDRMDPRQYMAPNPSLWMSRDLTLIDPLDDSWYFAVNADIDYLVFENTRSIAFRLSRQVAPRPWDQVVNSTALIGRFCETNSTVGIEMRAYRTRYRFFKQLTNVTSDTEEPKNCCVCLEPITRTSHGVAILSCGHFDHDECINEWFDENLSCPTCRQEDLSIVQ